MIRKMRMTFYSDIQTTTQHFALNVITATIQRVSNNRCAVMHGAYLIHQTVCSIYALVLDHQCVCVCIGEQLNVGLNARVYLHEREYNVHIHIYGRERAD